MLIISFVLLLGVNALQWWAASRDQGGGRIVPIAPALAP